MTAQYEIQIISATRRIALLVLFVFDGSLPRNRQNELAQVGGEVTRWCPNSIPLSISGVAQVISQLSKVNSHAALRVATEDMEQCEYEARRSTFSALFRPNVLLRSKSAPARKQIDEDRRRAACIV